MKNQSTSYQARYGIGSFISRPNQVQHGNNPPRHCKLDATTVFRNADASYQNPVVMFRRRDDSNASKKDSPSVLFCRTAIHSPSYMMPKNLVYIFYVNMSSLAVRCTLREYWRRRISQTKPSAEYYVAFKHYSFPYLPVPEQQRVGVRSKVSTLLSTNI